MNPNKLSFAAACSAALLALAGCTAATVNDISSPLTQQTVAPSFSVAPGSYSTTQTVALSTTTPGATIYYTTDGATPTASSSVYSGPIPVTSTETIAAMAAAPKYTASNTASATYNMSSTVDLSVSDDPTEDWATIGVKVESIALVPKGGGNAQTVYTAPTTGAPTINLVQLDQLGELLGKVTVPTGTYTQAILTLGANNTGSACDVSLVVSPDPEPGFPLAASATVPCSQIVINGASGTAPNQTVQTTVNLVAPLAVTTAGANVLNVEFDLKNPALIVEHQSATETQPIWAINFNGPIRHHPRPDLTQYLLRHLYGVLPATGAVSSDNTHIDVTRVAPVHPITNPETAVADSTAAIPIYADAANGTIFYDLDTKSSSTITSFSSVAAVLPGMYVRIAARYQVDGTLTATRIYASKTFNTIWLNPEGHIVHVNTKTNVMWVTTEDGKLTSIAIGPNTSFYYGASNAVIGTGSGFFDGTTPGKLPNVARGFKVNVTIDPLSSAKPPVAESVEIDVARYDGAITAPNSTSFIYGRTFADADALANDGYTGSIDYISSTSANTDQADNPIQGFYWWDFGFPTLLDSGSKAVSDFVSAVGSAATDFGGKYGVMQPVGISRATWNDPAAPSTWSAKWVDLLPVQAPMGYIVNSFAASTNSFTFTPPLPTVSSSAPPLKIVTVNLDTAVGSATLVYQVARQGNVITITPEDIGNPSTLAAVGAQLTSGAPVKIFGIPTPTGSIKAYTLFYYTGTASTM
jgi:hypothetical protein